MSVPALLAFILPAYFANAAPVLARGRHVVDFRKNFIDGKRLFGDGKTYEGLLAAIGAGTVAGALISQTGFFLPSAGFSTQITVAFLLSVGTMAGDLLGSFLKRRLNIPAGAQHEFFDQLLFLGGALLLASPYYLPTAEETVFLVAVTYVSHKAFNALAHALKLKKVPW